MTTTTIEIEPGDTVTMEGRRGHGTVNFVGTRYGIFDVAYCSGHPRRGGMRVEIIPDVPVERLTLVRKGSQEVDDMNELFAVIGGDPVPYAPEDETSRWRAARARHRRR